jgi:hypothetical protein
LGTSPFVIILAPNSNFAYTATVPAFNRNATGWQKIIGYGATITLSSGAPRAFDFNKVADSDKFSNIWLEGFTVDGNNLTDTPTQHIIIGTIANGTTLTKISLDNIVIRNIKTVNVSVTLGQARLNVWLVVKWVSGHAAQIITNILIENLDLQGGNEGVAIGVDGDSGTLANVFIDNVCIHRCKHSMLAVPTASFPANHFQIGNFGYGGRCHIADCYGEYSADDGVEINAMAHALIEDCLMRDTWTGGYFLTNYNLPLKASGTQGAEEQLIVLRDCRDRRIELSSDAAHHGFTLQSESPSNEPLGSVTLDACEYYATTSHFQAGDAINVLPSYGLTKLTVSKFKCELDGIVASGGTVILNPIYIGPTGSTAYASMNDIEIIGTGNKTAGTIFSRIIDLEGTMAIDIDNVKIDVQIANGDNYGMNAIYIGNSTSTIQGNISRLYIARLGADAYPSGISIRGTATLTIPTSINISGCNLSVCSQNQEINFADLTNVANVWLGQGNVFHAPYGVLANAFDTTNNHVGLGVYTVGGAAHPTSGEYVTAVNNDLLITSSGGIVTSIITYDPNGKQETSWGTTCQGVLLARGHQIRFVYLVAPTIVVSVIDS